MSLTLRQSLALRLLAFGALALTSCGVPAESPVDSLVPPASELTAPATTASSATSWPQVPAGVLASEDGVFLLGEGATAPGIQLWDQPAYSAYLVGTDLVVAQGATDWTGYPPLSAGTIMVHDRSGSRPMVTGDGHVVLVGGGIISRRPVAFVVSRTGDGPEDMDVRLLLVDLETDHRTNLGSVGGWESGIGDVRLSNGVMVFLAGSEGDVGLRALSLDGTELWSRPLGSGMHFSIVVEANEVTVLQPHFIEPDFTSALTVSRFALADGSPLGTTDLIFDLGEGVAIEGGFCFTAEWWGESLLCDQTYGGPLLIEPSGGVSYFGQFGQGVITTMRGDQSFAPGLGAPCPELKAERQVTDFAGPFFVCETDQGFGGRVFPREGVESADEALRAWVAGPRPEEAAAGYQGWDLTLYAKMTESITIYREGDILYMDIGEWEHVNNLSTSSGGGVFILSLFGTAFSDPTVEQFVLSVAGESCPLEILESTYCFPITWNDVVKPSIEGLDTVAVVLVGAGESLEVFDFTLGQTASQVLPSTATGIRVTGPGDGAMQTSWVPIELGGVSGEVDSRFLTQEVPDETFADDPEPAQVLEAFVELLRTRDRTLEVTGYKGLTVIHFDSKHHWTINDEPTIDSTLYEWSAEAGEPPWPRATFNDQIGVGMLDVWDDEDRVIQADEPISGPEAAPPFIPTEFQNFHFLAVHDPGDTPDAGGLDWVTWYVYFDFTPLGWRIAGLSVDSYAP